MITLFIIGALALSIGLRAIGFAMRCLGGVLQIFFGLFGLLLVPLALVCTLVWGLGRIVLPVLLILLALQLMFPQKA